MAVIRNFEIDDEEAILKLGVEIFRYDDEIPLLKKALGICVPELSFIIEEDEKIVGFTLVCVRMTHRYFEFMEDIENRYELAFLGISNSCQGRGYGTRLLKETLIAIFQTSNRFTCWLLVDQINSSAIKLYQRFGFRKWVETTSDKTPLPGYIMGLSYRRFSL